MPIFCKICGSIIHSDLGECKHCSSTHKELEPLARIPFTLDSRYSIVKYIIPASLLEIIPFLMLSMPFIVHPSWLVQPTGQRQEISWDTWLSWLGMLLHLPTIILSILLSFMTFLFDVGFLPYIFLTPILQILFWAWLIGRIVHSREVKIDPSLSQLQ